jgi:hypothetical protein
MDINMWKNGSAGVTINQYHVQEILNKNWIINIIYDNLSKIEFNDHREHSDNLNTFIRKKDNSLEHYVEGILKVKINISFI